MGHHGWMGTDMVHLYVFTTLQYRERVCRMLFCFLQKWFHFLTTPCTIDERQAKRHFSEKANTAKKSHAKAAATCGSVGSDFGVMLDERTSKTVTIILQWKAMYVMYEKLTGKLWVQRVLGSARLKRLRLNGHGMGLDGAELDLLW